MPSGTRFSRLVKVLAGHPYFYSDLGEIPHFMTLYFVVHYAHRSNYGEHQSFHVYS
jgi:hypothetical protein